MGESIGGAIAGLLLLGSIVIIYFLPYFLAVQRKHPNRVPIGIINVFLGWTLIGWIVALTWAATNFERRS